MRPKKTQYAMPSYRVVNVTIPSDSTGLASRPVDERTGMPKPLRARAFETLPLESPENLTILFRAPFRRRKSMISKHFASRVLERLIPGAAAFLLVAAGATAVRAQEVRTESLGTVRAGQVRTFEDTIAGDQVVEYRITGEATQVLSVDLQASNSSSYFSIHAADSDERLFFGSIDGNIADVRLPENGDYVIRVLLVRTAALRREISDYELSVSLSLPDFADGLSGGPDFWRVTGVGGSTLNLREGPSTQYPVIGTLANGEVLQNGGCRITGQERWCQIRTTDSGITGWVAGRYLAESAPPGAPAASEGD
jgi:hypothetical protein